MVLKHKDWKDVVFFCDAYEKLSESMIRIRGRYYNPGIKGWCPGEYTHSFLKDKLDQDWYECVLYAGDSMGTIDTDSAITPDFGLIPTNMQMVKRKVFGPVSL